MTSFKRFVSKTENLVLNSLIYCKPIKRFQNRSDTMKFRSSGDGTGCRIQNKLKTIDLSCRKIKQERVAVVDFRVNERSSNSGSSSAIFN